METSMIIEYNNIINNINPDPDFQQTYNHILNFSEDDDEEEESYIEIALEDDFISCSDDDEEMELRISFSSSFHLPYLISSSKSSLNSNSSSSSSSPVVVSQPVIQNIHFPAPNCNVVNTLTLSSDVDHTHMELLRPTRQNNVPSITMNNGMMMKMFVKFRDLKLIKTFLASLIRVSEVNSGGQKEKKAKQSQAKSKQQQQQNKTILEINLDAIRGVFGRKQTKGSKSFPIHRQQHQPLFSQTYLTCANDNSIQSAIAHCKR